MVFSILQCTRQPLTTETQKAAPNVDSTEIEKLPGRKGATGKMAVGWLTREKHFRLFYSKVMRWRTGMADLTTQGLMQLRR